MKKSLITSALVLAFAGAAHAGTYHADHFTVSYDDEFWGSTFAGGSGSTFSFAALEDIGLTAGVTGKKNLWKYDGWAGSSVLTIVADAGYQITGVSSGATGSLAAAAGSGSGSQGNAGVSTSSSWFNATNPALGYSSTDNAYASYAGGATSGNAGSFNSQALAAFASGTDAATLNYFTYGQAQAYGVGSSASAVQSSAYFNVVTAPVPEPESYALLLAGLGVMGAIARRRSRNTA